MRLPRPGFLSRPGYLNRPIVRRAGAIALVLGVGVALAAASAVAGPVTPSRPVAQPLPVSPRTASVVCPGPEGLSVPEGADPVAPGGPVTLSVAVTGAPPGTAPRGTASPAVGAAVTPLASVAGQGQAAGPGHAAGHPGDEAVPVKASAASAGVATVPLTQAGAVAFTARTPAGAQAPLTGGVQTTLARSGDLRSLVGAGCAAPATQNWLVGSGTGPGRRARLLVANPAPAPATVDVHVLTPDGPVDPVNGQGVLVPAQSQIALLVDALVPGKAAVAVRVQAREGRVVATLQDSLLRGLVAGGVDDVVAGTGPAPVQAVPGLDVRASAVKDGPDRLPADPGDPGAVAVRVAVPGTQDAVVTVKLVGSTGAVALPAGVANVAAGAVADFPVSGVPDGEYTAVVQADVPVVAGAVIGRAVKGSELAGTPDGVAVDVPPAELAWAAATDPLATSLVPLPPAVPARLIVGALGRASVVKITPVASSGAFGAARLLKVPAGRTVAAALPSAAAAVLLEPLGGPVHAAIALEVADPAGPMVSVLALQPPLSSTRRSLPVVERPRLH